MHNTICPTDRVPTIPPTLLSRDVQGVEPGYTLAGRYEIIRHLETGAMGSVYVACQLSMNRKVAVKVLPRHMNLHRERVRRFFVEARAIGAMNHPNVVRALDFGIDEGAAAPFLVMELVDGLDLDRLLEREGPLTELRAVRVLRQVAQALTEAHSRGVVHRDLKPANLILSDLTDGREHVKVLDFGVAKMVASTGDSSPETPAMTGVGNVVGTPEYMSPEQARGREVDHRSDLYALGCILYALLTDRPPFEGDDPMSVFIQHIKNPHPALPERLVDGQPPSPALVALYEALMAKSPADRPQRATDVAAALERVAAALVARQQASADWEGRSAGLLALETSPELASREGTRESRPTPEPRDPDEDQRSRRPAAWLWAAGVALLVGGGLFVALTGGEEPPAFTAAEQFEHSAAAAAVPGPQADEAESAAESTSEPAPAPAAEAEAAPGAEAEAQPAAEAEAEPAAAAAAEPEPEPEPPTVTLETIPAGAVVRDGQDELGQTPLEVERPAEGARVLTVALDGFEVRQIDLAAEGPARFAIELERKRPARRVDKKRVARPAAARDKPEKKKAPADDIVPVW